MGLQRISIFIFISTILLSCIGEDIVEDFVEAELRIENPLESLALNESYQFNVIYFNNVGQEESVDVLWSSSDEAIVSINSETGVATAIQSGRANITATALSEQMVSLSFNLEVSDETIESEGVKRGTIESTSSYTLRGDFTLEENSSGNLVLFIDNNYKASASLPGLYVYLTNNPNSITNAFELSAVSVFEGAHSYSVLEGIALNDYEYLLYWCKPFSVKVGGGNIE